MSTTQWPKWPPLSPGVKVSTTSAAPGAEEAYTEEAQVERRWGVSGKIINHHDSHDLCYEVEHDDGSVGLYDPTELRVEDVFALDPWSIITHLRTIAADGRLAEDKVRLIMAGFPSGTRVDLSDHGPAHWGVHLQIVGDNPYDQITISTTCEK